MPIFLKSNADSDSVIYWDKEKSQDLSVNLGVQFPNIMTSLSSGAIIHQSKAFVNTQSEKLCVLTVTPTPFPIVPFSPMLLRVWRKTITNQFIYYRALTTMVGALIILLILTNFKKCDIIYAQNTDCEKENHAIHT